jgi:hypothetical protein
LLASLRGLLAIAVEDCERAQSAYQVLLPHAARPAGTDSVMPLWPVAHVLGDLARYLGRSDADEHYRHALAIADRAGAPLWRDAAQRRLGAQRLPETS